MTRNREVEQGEHTRDALVTTAVALPAEKGYAGTSTTDPAHALVAEGRTTGEVVLTVSDC